MSKRIFFPVFLLFTLVFLFFFSSKSFACTTWEDCPGGSPSPIVDSGQTTCVGGSCLAYYNSPPPFKCLDICNVDTGVWTGCGPPQGACAPAPTPAPSDEPPPPP